MLPPDSSLLIAFIKAPAELTSSLRNAILDWSPGELAEFQLHTTPIPAGGSPAETGLADLLSRNDGVTRVVLVGFSETDRIPLPLLTILASRAVVAIVRLEVEDGRVSFHDHRPLEDLQSRTLLVFPGPIIPVMMGSHRRAFQLLANLAAQGCPLDLLITGGGGNKAEAAKPLLYQIAPRITHYKNPRPPLPGRLKWRKRLERGIRIMTGTLRPPPDLFEERLSVGASVSGRQTLRRLLESGHYRTVIVSYAWLANIRDFLMPSEIGRISWLCDSHDVQFVRNATDNTREKRYFRQAGREKQCELEVLNRFDKVIAISEPDARSLEMELGADRVILAPSGFDYSLGEPRQPSFEAPVFGFIGRLMRANEKALQHILADWWPAIRHRWPEATLRIAGTICGSPQLPAGNSLPAGIVADHLVADLGTWYRQIDVILNPVMVQGGLNFKSVEAIMQGKLLLTNSTGSGCLANPGFASIAESGAEAVARLEDAFASPRYLEERSAIRDEARQIFGDEPANRELVRFLRNAETPARTSLMIAGPSKVLIQCGDHHENRLRISALARAIRDRGHHPIALVYKQEFVAPFLALGVDAVALEPFDAGGLGHQGRDDHGFDTGDISAMWQMQNPAASRSKKRATLRGPMQRNIGRCAAMLEQVRPDQLIIWNGHTGWVANILRHHARRHGLPRWFLERSIFADGVFVDPQGTNGNSQLARSDRHDLETSSPIPLPEAIRIHRSAEQIAELRGAGPWKTAGKLIFIPLQVQGDSNILLHSPHYRTMAEFVTAMHRAYHDPGVAFVIRPHPEEIDRDLQLPALPDLHIDSSGDLDSWIMAADQVVTINSTVGMQALLNGRPVRAYGHAIYTGKGLANGAAPSPAAVAAFWKTLVTRHTSTPQHPFPECLVEALPFIGEASGGPTLEDTATRAAGFLTAIRQQAIQAGVLWVVTGAPASLGKLDLSYRRLAEPFDESSLCDRLRRTLDIGDIAIRCIETHTGEEPHVHIQRPGMPLHSPGFDKYGWVIVPPTSDAHRK